MWLAPVQAIVIPITDRAHDYADKIFKLLQDEGIRAEVDKRNEKLQYKIIASTGSSNSILLLIT